MLPGLPVLPGLPGLPVLWVAGGGISSGALSRNASRRRCSSRFEGEAGLDSGPGCSGLAAAVGVDPAARAAASAEARS